MISKVMIGKVYVCLYFLDPLPSSLHPLPTPSHSFPSPPPPPSPFYPAKVRQNKKFLGIKRAKAPCSSGGSREGTGSSASGRTPESSLGCEFIAVQSQLQDQPRGACMHACVRACVHVTVYVTERRYKFHTVKCFVTSHLSVPACWSSSL